MVRKARNALAAAAALLGTICALRTPAFAAKPGEWEYVATDDNVVVYRKEVEGSPIVAFRGVTYASINLGKLLAVFTDGSQRKHWVDRYVEHTTFERTDTSETYWIHFGLPWPVSDRDYVLQTTMQPDPENHRVMFHIKSVESPKKGADDCCVRATVYGTFYEFTAIPGEQKTKLVVEVHTDPKGSLPAWLVNLIQKSWPRKTLHGLIQHVLQSSVQPLPAYAGWHEKHAAPAVEATGASPGPAAPPAEAPAPGGPANGAGGASDVASDP